jgi:aryl-alcohol dehydrogenase-like predicted oxidoreductase
MQQRPLGRTGRLVSAIGLGTWQLGADWGDVSESDARAVLEASADHGVTLFDSTDGSLTPTTFAAYARHT